MEREIKFRAFNTKTKEMLIQGDSQDENRSLFWHIWETTSHMTQPDQYTGLKDSKGVEVYNGDIVNVSGLEDRMPIDTRYEIKWSEENYCMIAYNEAEWLMIADIVGCTVIGNVHQHPHLLNK